MTRGEEGTSHTLTLLSSFLVLLPAFPHSQHTPVPVIPNSPVCVYLLGRSSGRVWYRFHCSLGSLKAVPYSILFCRLSFASEGASQ